MKSILFYWSKGADVRREIIMIIRRTDQEEKPSFLNSIAGKLSKTHVAIKNHIDLLEEEGYLQKINPDGKPVFLKLTKKGQEIAKELEKN